MITQFDALNETADSDCSAWTVVPMEQLVQEVYAASQPDAQDHILAKLVGKVFETAPIPMRVHLLEQLMRSVGVLAPIAIANGIFAKIRFRSGWPATHLRLDDVQTVQPDDVIALVEHVLRTRANELNGLLNELLNAPHIAETGAAAVLVAILLQRASGVVVDRKQSKQPTSLFATL